MQVCLEECIMSDSVPVLVLPTQGLPIFPYTTIAVCSRDEKRHERQSKQKHTPVQDNRSRIFPLDTGQVNATSRLGVLEAQRILTSMLTLVSSLFCGLPSPIYTSLA